MWLASYLLLIYLRNQVSILGRGEVQLQAFPELDIVEEVTKFLQGSHVASLQQPDASVDTSVKPRAVFCYRATPVTCTYHFATGSTAVSQQSHECRLYACVSGFLKAPLRSHKVLHVTYFVWKLSFLIFFCGSCSSRFASA